LLFLPWADIPAPPQWLIPAPDLNLIAEITFDFAHAVTTADGSFYFGYLRCDEGISIKILCLYFFNHGDKFLF
jgi:hypothetical protein